MQDLQKSVYAGIQSINRLNSKRMFYYHLLSTPVYKNIKYAIAKLSKKFRKWSYLYIYIYIETLLLAIDKNVSYFKNNLKIAPN